MHNALQAADTVLLQRDRPQRKGKKESETQRGQIINSADQVGGLSQAKPSTRM